MLSALAIRDFVIVDQLELEFEPGFTVLTGETGAGKSILIGALQFVLGERAEADTVREGCARAEVGAQFHCGASVAAWLAQAGFDVAPDAGAGVDAGAAAGTNAAAGADGDRNGVGCTVLLRRGLDASGRSRAFINGSPATLAQLREIGQLLLDVHGQHEHQLLLRAPAQQQLLDELGALDEPARRVAGAFDAWRAAARACAQAQAAHEEAAARSAQLEHEIGDLEQLAPEPGEWERVEVEQKRLAHGAALLEGARLALDGIADAGDAAQPRLARIETRLAALSAYDDRLAPALASIGSARINLEEASRELNQYVASCELDEGRLAQVEERIAALHAAGRRWRCAPAQLPERLAAARARRDALAAAQDLDALRAAEATAAATFARHAAVLSEARRGAADAMGREVTRAMQDLAMAGGRFEVRLVPTEPAGTGLEKAEFLVSGHAAGTARPLARVASGGELSRIGLAIAVIAASANPVPTLIFDEVDAGIGGQVAATVGRLLQQLGRSRQVFCVTHLPQVAACGDHHLAVRKTSGADGRPQSQTQTLTAAARVQEIARMLGGAQITDLTQRHAREMLTGR
jgi:DNA repair protein RecN (Recombination protein N)